MTLEDLIKVVPSFSGLNHTDRIKVLAWWLATFGGRSTFTVADIRSCYGTLRFAPPTNINSFLRSLESRDPPQMIETRGAWHLERAVFDELTEKYGKRDATIHVEKLLTDLPKQLTNLQERAYLEECLICLRNRAYRATVVMAWNLAYDHFCYWILNDTGRLAAFNARAPVRYPRMKYPPVVKREDFMDMTERHVIDIASSASVITTNVSRIMQEKLTRRNMAAHPADVSTLQPTAEEVIRDLVENVVLKLT